MSNPSPDASRAVARPLEPDDQALVQRYRRGVAVVEAALATITEEELDQRANDGWSARMVVHHLADSETNSYLRLRRLLAEEAPTVIQGYDEAKWARCQTLGYESLPIEGPLDVFLAVRASSASLLDRVHADDMDRVGRHTESGNYTLRDWLRIYAEHAEDHAQQIVLARRGERGVTP